MNAARLALTGALLVIVPARGLAQPPERTGSGAERQSSVAEFVAQARAGTAAYHARSAAIAAGYRPIGGDFPGMGEHWIHLGWLMSGTVEAGRPQILSYGTIEGEPKLIGVAYAVPVADGETPPDYPAGRAAWHYHSQSVDEESFATDHFLHPGAPGVRVAVLHVWIWLENPAGLFARDNWALPFARLGVREPPDTPPEAARAISLLSGGDVYYSSLARSCGSSRPERIAAVEKLIGEKRAAVAKLAHRAPAERNLTSSDVAALADLWIELRVEFESALGCRLP